MEYRLDVDDVGKYRKRSDTNRSKSKKKAKHKHDYKDVLYRYEVKYFGKVDIRLALGEECKECGKRRLKNSLLVVKTKENRYRVLSTKEILERCKGLDIIDVKESDLYK